MIRARPPREAVKAARLELPLPNEALGRWPLRSPYRSLTLMAVYLGSSDSYKNTTASKPPFWFPPLCPLHFTSTVSTFLMGLSVWLMWAEGGFHASPTGPYLYLTQLFLSLVWDPIVFGTGSSWAGLVMCVGMLGVLIGCYQAFKEVNPIASEFIKPCLARTAFLALVNLTLVYP